MFDRHQAEITVMQFTGHSLPVHQSMSVPWDFLPCPISLAKHAYAISSHNCHWNVSLPSGASLWKGKLAGSKIEIQLFNHNGKRIELKFSLLELKKKNAVLGFDSQAADRQGQASRSDLSSRFSAYVSV